MRFYLRALSYYRTGWPLIGLLLLCVAMASSVGALMAWPMAILVDSVFGVSEPHGIHRLFLWVLPDHKLGQIIGLAAMGVLMKLLADGLAMLQTVINNHINYRGLLRARCDLYRKLQALHLDYHRNQPQGDAIYRLSSDTLGFQAILGVFIGLFAAVLGLVNILSIMLSRNVTLTLLALSITPVLAVTNVIFGRRLRQRTIECKEYDAEFTTNIQRSMSSIGLVQAFGREADEFGRFRTTIDNTISAWWRLNWQQLSYNLIVGTTFGIGGAIVFGYGGYLVYQNQFIQPTPGALTVGDLMVFASYLGMLWGPLCTLTGFSAALAGGAAGAKRVFEVLDRDAQIRDLPDAIDLPVKPRQIELYDVHLEYVPGRPVLNGVSARIEPGQMVAFVGSSGVGKSTLMNLLPRFYDPRKGAVRFDQIDARHVKVADLRRHVALVLQESVILPTTVAENIAYGKPGASSAEIIRAAEIAGCAEFIEQMPQGYDTVIAEGGVNLSGGQRQRLSIARALLTEAPIIVLDEPTSALDPEHERRIIETLRALKGKRTIVMVSHRLSTVVDCDQIFVMEDGRVVEQGTHEQLMEIDASYARMFRQQLRLEAPAAVPETAPAPQPAPAQTIHIAA